MGHSSGQCTNGQDAEEDDCEHFLSASCLSCKKHTRAANTLPDQPLEPDMTSPFLKIEYAIGLLEDPSSIPGGAAQCFFRLIQLSVHICRIELEKGRSLIRWNGPDWNEFST